MVLPLLALALVLQLAFALPALAKSYTMGPVVIEAQVKPDGSMSVVEQRSFDFNGDFSRVFWDLATRSGQADHGERRSRRSSDGQARPLAPTDYAARRATGRPAPTTSTRPAGMTSVSTYFRKSDEQATFRLTYDVADAAQRYQDTAELYWQFIGTSGRCRHPTSPSPSSPRSRSPRTRCRRGRTAR